MAKKNANLAMSVEQGLKYPWLNAKRQWNILWILIPIFGWFALFGYIRNILVDIMKGKGQGLPAFGNFWDNFVMGLKLFVYLIPIMVVITLIQLIPLVGVLLGFLLQLLFIPYIVMHLMATDRFGATFDFKTWWRVVLGNFMEYVVALVKTLVYAVVYGLLSLIIIGIPSYALAGYIFLADFYKRHP